MSLHGQVYEFAVDRWPDFALLRVSLAVELIKCGQVDDAKRVLKVAFELDPDLRLMALDHPGLDVQLRSSSPLTTSLAGARGDKFR
jgi:hypothetical protein